MSALYLKLYNGISLLGWAAVLVQVLRYFPLISTTFLNSMPLLMLVQTSALLEVLHSALSIVKSPVSSTIIQVSSRIFVVWAVLYTIGYNSSAIFSSYVYVSMVVAWCITECVRYGYYLTSLMNWEIKWLLWCRYSLFYVLYPIGAGSEAYLVYLAIPFAGKIHPFAPFLFKLVLAIYVPGFITLYSYMIKQRKKYISGSTDRSTSRKMASTPRKGASSSSFPVRSSPRRKSVKKDN